MTILGLKKPAVLNSCLRNKLTLAPIHFHANGKLLLSGEYFVLDGAKAIGLPCKWGQSLNIKSSENNSKIFWNSKLVDGQSWFQCTFRKSDLTILSTSDQSVAKTLQNILRHAKMLNPDFLDSEQSISVETALEFPRLWGLGSSSTLIHSIAKWSNVNPFELSEKTLGGSGYDIACAGAESPIFYQILNGKPVSSAIDFLPSFADHLFFIYLDKKQNSREGIQQYRSKKKPHATILDEVSGLSEVLAEAKSLIDFQKALNQHEQLVSSYIKLPKVLNNISPISMAALNHLAPGEEILFWQQPVWTIKQQRIILTKKGLEVFLKYKEMVKG